MSVVSPKGIVCSTVVESEMCDGGDVKPLVVRMVVVEIVPKDDTIIEGSYVEGFYPGTQSIILT